MSPPRLLLSAYQCAPEGGSVSHIGWEWYSRLARHLPTTLVTHIRNRDALLQAGAPLPNSELLFIDTEWFIRPLLRGSRKLFFHTQYPVALLSFADFYLYDWLAVNQLLQQQQQGKRWDLIHQVTPVSPKSATRLHRLHNPLILGPWNGGLTVSWAFPKIILQDFNWLYPCRYLGSLVDWSWQSTRQAHLILTATRATLNSVPKAYHSHCHPFLENGVDLQTFKPAPWPTFPSAQQPLQILFVGRLVAFKGLDLLLQALAILKQQRPLHLSIVGSGPLEKRWKKLAITLGLSENVTWQGQLKLAGVVEQLHQSHVLCLPSVRESGGSILIEAMACARPVIAIDHGGPAELIDANIGQLLPATGGKTVIEALIISLNSLFEHPEIWKQRGEMGRQRAEQYYDWEIRVNKMLTIYQNILENKSTLS